MKAKSSKLKEILLFTLFSVFLCFVMLSPSFLQDEKQTIKITGVYHDYNIITSGIKSKKRISITVGEKSFFIKTLILPSFRESFFLQKVHIGDTINITLENSTIIQISKKNKNFIDEQLSKSIIQKDNYFGLILGFIFFVFSIALIFKYVQQRNLIADNKLINNNRKKNLRKNKKASSSKIE